MESKQLMETFCIPTKGLGRCLVQRNSVLSCTFTSLAGCFNLWLYLAHCPLYFYDPFTVLLSNLASIYCIQVFCHWKVLGACASYLSLSLRCSVLVLLGLVLLIRSHILCQKILRATIDQAAQMNTDNANLYK